MKKALTKEISAASFIEVTIKKVIAAGKRKLIFTGTEKILKVIEKISQNERRVISDTVPPYFKMKVWTC